MDPHRLRFPVLSFLALAFCGSLVHAAEPESVKFRAVCFDPRETVTPEFYMGSNKASRKRLDLDKSRLSESQEAPVRAGRKVDFFLTKEPKKDEKPAVTLTLPENLTVAMLVVFAPSGTSYQAWAIPLPPQNFPKGSTLLVNTTPNEISVIPDGGKAIRVLPSKHQILKAPDGLKDEMLPIQIYKKAPGHDAWQIVQSTRWAVDFRFRSYVFFYQPKNGRMMLHGISERVDSPENAGK